MLLVGADVVGHDDICQNRFIAIVIGTDVTIKKLHNKIGIPYIHMQDLSPAKRKRVMTTIDFSEHDISAWCLEVERQNITDEVKNHVRLNPKNKRSSIIQKHFDYLLLKEIRISLDQFTISRGSHLEELTMQCDDDMILTGQNWNMGTSRKGKAFELADAVAFCNNKRHHIDGCHEIDLRDNLHEKMLHSLLK